MEKEILRHVQLLILVAVGLLALDLVFPAGWSWVFTPLYGVLYATSLLPLSQRKSKLRNAAFILGSGVLYMALVIAPHYLYSASHSPVAPNSSGFFTNEALVKFLIGSPICAILFLTWIKLMIVDLKPRAFLFAPLFTIPSVYPMAQIHELGYWSWCATVFTWWVGFTVAIAFSLNVKRANKSLKNGTPQSAAP